MFKGKYFLLGFFVKMCDRNISQPHRHEGLTYYTKAMINIDKKEKRLSELTF